MKRLMSRIRSMFAFVLFLVSIAGFVGMLFLQDYASSTIVAQAAIGQLNNTVESSAYARAFIDNYHTVVNLGIGVFGLLGGVGFYFAFLAPEKASQQEGRS